MGQHRDPMHPAVPFAGKHGARPDVSDQVARIRCALADIFRRPRTIQQPPTFGVQIAQSITGTRWNGPRFFGLRDKPSKEAGAS